MSSLVESTLATIATSSSNAQAFLIFLLVVLAVRHWCHNPYTIPPGPAGWPVVGYALQLKDSPLHLAFTSLAKQYGKLFTLYLGRSLILVLNDAVSIQEALVKQADAFSERKVPETVRLTFPSKGSILYDTGDNWRAVRRFTVGAMRTFGVGKMSISLRINEEVRILCDCFEQYKETPFNPRMPLSSAVSNVICQMSFGHRFDYDNKNFVMLQENLRKRMMIGRTSLVNYFPLLFYTPLYKELRELDAARRKHMQAIVKEHQSTFDPENIRDMIDLFFKEVRESSKCPFIEENVERLLHDLFGAGTDTSANMLAWLLLIMTQYPDVQLKIQEELEHVIGCGRQPTWCDRCDLPYCHAVMLEVFRFRPAGPLAVPHLATYNTKLMGYDIPKGTTVLVNIYAAHFDPDYWDNPELFRPERFLSKDGKEVVKPTHGSYLPFGIGPRSCPGEQLARMELFLFMTNLMQRFTFQQPDNDPKPDMEGVFSVTLSPKPFRVCAIPRHAHTASKTT
ncbi:cytochrome P450 2U1-like [Asterias rubens]|uniref:cytochrome P450 2U1-like n=1 Tax=Asterias rubens TaxID=7604 RepID=UPI001455D824|nr:cytochrome P450 2U1-like [Asterias rubens]